MQCLLYILFSVIRVHLLAPFQLQIPRLWNQYLQQPILCSLYPIEFPIDLKSQPIHLSLFAVG